MTEHTQVVAVFGLGYVGCVTAACLSGLGHRVVGVDKDEHKVRSVMAGRSPFFEPGLDAIVSKAVSAGRLGATTSATEALRGADIALICVGTPSRRDGNLTTDYLKSVCGEIQEALAKSPSRSVPLIVAIRSTVFPGTCDEVVIPGLGASEAVVIVHPEFMREGSAIADFQQPPLLVFGGPDRAVLERAAALYAPLKIAPSFVSMRTAEMIKYACNAFHAIKIGFANEIGALSAQLGIDGEEVMATLCEDTTLNISKAYLKPGLAFGGSCLPKDLRALVYRAKHHDLKLTLLESILPSNDEHLRRGIQTVLDLPKGRIGVFGLAFKENTDDLRESPVVTLLEQLIGKGRDVRVFDPHIRLDEIYGSNRNFILSAIPHIARLLEADFDQMASWADYIVVAQKPAPEFAERINRSGRTLVNLVRVLAPSAS
ncbi:MAG TPA: nucleotide sugar dehydrogenase [Vicinamibacterales bacterium]|nr:nucleotide sugar dehydrogenase [Vicinamibacterales bacterium]